MDSSPDVEARAGEVPAMLGAGKSEVAQTQR